MIPRYRELFDESVDQHPIHQHPKKLKDVEDETAAYDLIEWLKQPESSALLNDALKEEIYRTGEISGEAFERVVNKVFNTKKYKGGLKLVDCVRDETGTAFCLKTTEHSDPWGATGVKLLTTRIVLAHKSRPGNELGDDSIEQYHKRVNCGKRVYPNHFTVVLVRNPQLTQFCICLYPTPIFEEAIQWTKTETDGKVSLIGSIGGKQYFRWSESLTSLSILTLLTNDKNTYRFPLLDEDGLPYHKVSYESLCKAALEDKKNRLLT